MRTALFVFSTYQYYREMFPVARYFKNEGWDVHVLIGWSGSTAQEVDCACRDAGIKIIHVPAPLNYGDQQHLSIINKDKLESGVQKKRIRAKITSRAPRFTKRIVTTASKFYRVRKTKIYAENLLGEFKPAVVFGGPWGSNGNLDNGIALWTRILKIPYLCLSFSSYLGESYVTDARFNNLKAGMVGHYVRNDYDLINRVLFFIFPSWTRTRGSETIFFWDPLEILACKILKMTDANPWQKPSENYDLAFVFSEYSKNLAIESKYEEAKIVVAGMPVLDQVIDGLRNDNVRASIFDDLGFPSQDGFVLWNIEPGLEHSYASSEDHWQRFNDQFAALKKFGMNAVLSLHPLCKLETYEFVEKFPGFKISRNYTIHQLYPYCSLVLSHPCSTNFLAEQFDKPLIIFDYHGLTTTENTKSLFARPGAFYAKDPEEFAVQLEAAKMVSSCAIRKPPTVSASKIIYEETIRRFFEASGPI